MCALSIMKSVLKWHRLQRRLLYDARLQPKIVKTIPVQAGLNGSLTLVLPGGGGGAATALMETVGDSTHQASIQAQHPTAHLNKLG